MRFHAHFFKVKVEFIPIIYILREEHTYAQFVPIMDNIFVKKKVKNSFNIELKPFQIKVLKLLSTSKNDVIVSCPTEYGKTFCFALFTVYFCI